MIKIEITDEKTGQITTSRLLKGDFTVITTPPCYLDQHVEYRDGTVVLTLKGFKKRKRVN